MAETPEQDRPPRRKPDDDGPLGAIITMLLVLGLLALFGWALGFYGEKLLP